MFTLTEEKIIETAQALKAAGTNPTQVSVREALGGKGSFATIGPVLKKWKDAQKEDHALAEVEAPEHVSERFDQLKGVVWKAAVDEAETRLVAQRAALTAAQAEAEAEVTEQRESVAQLEAEAVKYSEAIEALSADVDTRTAQLQQLSTELKEVTEQALDDSRSASEALTKETSRADAAVERAQRAEALHDTVQSQSREDRDSAAKSAREDLETLKQEHTAVIAALNIEIEAARAAAVADVKKAEEAEQKALSRAIQAEKEAQQLVAGEQVFQSLLETAQRDVEQAQSRVAPLEEKVEKAIQEAAELRGELKAMKK